MASVYDFGAAGDGQTDDTEALQHAIADGNGTLQFGKGSFRITKPLLFDLTKTGYAAVQGTGGATRIVMDGPGPAIRIVGTHQGTASPPSIKPLVWQNERMPTVSGLEILGAHPQAVGIELTRTIQPTVTGVLIRNCWYGVHLVERNRNVLISHCHIFDNDEYGIFFDECNLHQTIISACHISYNKRAGIKSLNGDVHNLHITGNDIEYNNRPGTDEPAADIWFEAPAGRISEVSIASNTIQATVTPNGANIRIHGEETDSPNKSPLIAISGNVIGSQTRAIELRNVNRLSITGNTIYDSDDLSLLIQKCSGISVGSNTIVWRADDSLPERDGIRVEDSSNVSLHNLVTERLCSGSEDTGAAIELLRCRESSVTGCQVLDPRHRGIELTTCRNCRVTDNTVIDRREQPTMCEAIRVRDLAGTVIVRNNLVGGATRALFSINGQTELPDSNAVAET
ncbi:hypothetical protein GC176_04770 [bacterium]|nr:hypothetical protein [bacterium]